MSTRASVPRDEAAASGPPEKPARVPDHNGRLAVFDLDRTLLPGSSLSLFGRAIHRAGMVANRRMAGYLAREAVFVRRGQGVTSASPQPLVGAAARAVGAERAVGTRAEVVDGRFTGRLEAPFCHGRGKLVRLWVEVGPADLSRATASSDSGSDLPLLSAAGTAVAVNPGRRLRREARTRGWPVLAF